MNRNWRLGAATLIAVLTLVAGCSTQLRDVDSITVVRYDGKPLTMTDMERAIRLAIYHEGWQDSQLVQPGHFLVTKHDGSGQWSATVDILYGAGTYSIHYHDSRGLRYHPTANTIAHTYKGIVEDLSDSIGDAAQDLNLGDK